MTSDNSNSPVQGDKIYPTEKYPIPPKLLHLIHEQMKAAPPGHLDEDLRARVKEFHGTDLELFDFLSDVAEKSGDRVSSFVRALCDLRRYYLPPESVVG